MRIEFALCSAIEGICIHRWGRRREEEIGKALWKTKKTLAWETSLTRIGAICFETPWACAMRLPAPPSPRRAMALMPVNHKLWFSIIT